MVRIKLTSAQLAKMFEVASAFADYRAAICQHVEKGQKHDGDGKPMLDEKGEPVKQYYVTRFLLIRSGGTMDAVLYELLDDQDSDVFEKLFPNAVEVETIDALAGSA
jgi:hypothetical protein